MQWIIRIREIVERKNLLPFMMLAIFFVLLYRVDRFMKYQIGEQLGRGIVGTDETVEEGWDEDVRDQIVKLFIPKWQEEILDQRRIIEKYPEDEEKVINACLKMAEIYEKKEKFKEAEDICNGILKNYPDNSLRKKAYLKLISVYEKDKNFVRVRELNELFIYEFPDDVDIVKTQLLTIGTYESEGNYGKAAEEYEKFLTKYPKIKSADYLFFKTGLLYRKSGSREKAQEIFRTVADSGEGIWRDNAGGEIWLYTKEGISSKRVYSVMRVLTAPEIDGELKESCWSEADAAADYLILKGEGIAKQRTETRVVYDSKCLYIGSTCYESEIHMMKADITKRDGTVWHDNSVEYFIDTNRDYHSYYQFIVNSIGTQYDKKCYCKGSCTADWNCKWRVVTQVGTKSWSCEIAIPFASLEVSSAQRGQVWGMNFCRNSHTMTKEHSAWSGKAFHNPESLGYLIFN